MINPPGTRAPRSPHRTRRWMAVLAIVPASGLLGAGVAQAAPAAGNAKPFSLSATALLAQDGTTQLALKVTSNAAGYAAPSSLKHVQLKSFDGAGELVFTKNTTDVATPGGAVTLTRDDLQAGQPLKVQAQAQTGQSKNAQVLETLTVVQRRPDLTVADANAPAQVAPGATLAIAAVVEELNEDLGATGTVSVNEGATVLDTVDVSVAAGSTTNVGLAVVLDQPGTHTLTVSVGGVQPTEWDTTNNSASLIVEVIQPNQTLDYNGSYHNTADYSYEWQSDGTGYYCGWYYYSCGPRHYVRHDQSESLSVQYWTNQTISPSGTFDLTIATEAGEVQALHATGLQWDGYSWYWYDPVSNTQVQIQPNGNGGSNVYLWHSAGTWTYSDSYCDWWYGCSTYSGSNTSGTYWNARQQLTVDLDVATTTGEHFGGGVDIPLSPYQYSWDDSYWDWYEGNIHSWGDQTYFAGSSSGTTAW